MRVSGPSPPCNGFVSTPGTRVPASAAVGRRQDRRVPARIRRRAGRHPPWLAFANARPVAKPLITCRAQMRAAVLGAEHHDVLRIARRTLAEEHAPRTADGGEAGRRSCRAARRRGRRIGSGRGSGRPPPAATSRRRRRSHRRRSPGFRRRRRRGRAPRSTSRRTARSSPSTCRRRRRAASTSSRRRVERSTRIRHRRRASFPSRTPSSCRWVQPADQLYPAVARAYDGSSRCTGASAAASKPRRRPARRVG